MASIERFIRRKLRLKVNEAKSAIRRPWDCKFLGFSFTNRRNNPEIRLHWKTIQRFKERVRELTRRTRGRSVAQVIRELTEFFRGWWGYYRLTQSTNRLRPLSHWIRRRLRSLVWVQWKNRRTRVRELLRRGVSRPYALTTGCSRKGPWHMSTVKWVVIALPDLTLRDLGTLVPLAIACLTSRTAEYGPVCSVVWRGSPREGRPYPDGRLLIKLHCRPAGADEGSTLWILLPGPFGENASASAPIRGATS